MKLGRTCQPKGTLWIALHNIALSVFPSVVDASIEVDPAEKNEL